MTFLDLKGRKKTLKKATQYLIDWNAKTRSKFQDSVKQFLRPHWERDQVFEELRIVGTLCTFDLYNATSRVVCEIQGSQHGAYNKFFHRGSKMNFVAQIKRDLDKHEFCRLNNITLVEIMPKDKLSEKLFADQGVIL
jgi:hypothetical protein